MTAQLQHGVERFRGRAVCQAGGQVVPPLLKLVQHVRQRLHSVTPPFRSAAPIGRSTISDNHRQFRRRSRGSNLAPRPVRRGSLGGGRGAIAAGWWSWHPGLISRDASRVQWRFFVEPPIYVGERSGQLRPYVRPVARRSPLVIMGYAYVRGTNLFGGLEGTPA